MASSGSILLTETEEPRIDAPGAFPPISLPAFTSLSSTPTTVEALPPLPSCPPPSTETILDGVEGDGIHPATVPVPGAEPEFTVGYSTPFPFPVWIRDEPLSSDPSRLLRSPSRVFKFPGTTPRAPADGDPDGVVEDGSLSQAGGLDARTRTRGTLLWLLLPTVVSGLVVTLGVPVGCCFLFGVVALDLG